MCRLSGSFASTYWVSTVTKKRILYITMEIKARELEGRALLALEAASRGFRVVIGHMSQINRGLQVGELPPGLYYEKSLSRGKEEKFGTIVNNGCLLASQDEESGILDHINDRFMSIRSTFETVDLADAIFCWGNFDHEAWTRHYPNSIEKIHLTGCPRVDFWRPDFQRYYHKCIDSIRERFGCFVLVASNFVTANNYMTAEQLVQQARRSGKIDTLEDEQSLRARIEDGKKMFRHFVNLINILADKHRDIHFVVRPHPAEKMSGWESSLSKSSNAHVIFEGGISNWVRASSAVLHNGCTTGMEAYAAGVPAIAYIPFASPINREIPNQLSIKCVNEDEIVDNLPGIMQGGFANEQWSEDNDKLVESRLINLRGDTAVSRIVTEFEKLDIPVSRQIKGGFNGWTWGLKDKIQRFVRTTFGETTRSMRKFPGLQLYELKQIQNDLADCTDKYKECSIRHLYGDLFVVE